MNISHTGVGIAYLVNNITRGQYSLGDRKSRLRSSKASTDSVRAAGQVEAENAEMRLYLATIISLLIAKRVISPEEFQEICSAIDGLDGVVDGRFDGEISQNGSIEAGDKAQEDLALRELASIVNKKQNE